MHMYFQESVPVPASPSQIINFFRCPSFPPFTYLFIYIHILHSFIFHAPNLLPDSPLTYPSPSRGVQEVALDYVHHESLACSLRHYDVIMYPFCKQVVCSRRYHSGAFLCSELRTELWRVIHSGASLC